MIVKWNGVEWQLIVAMHMFLWHTEEIIKHLLKKVMVIQPKVIKNSRYF